MSLWLLIVVAGIRKFHPLLTGRNPAEKREKSTASLVFGWRWTDQTVRKRRQDRTDVVTRTPASLVKQTCAKSVASAIYPSLITVPHSTRYRDTDKYKCEFGENTFVPFRSGTRKGRNKDKYRMNGTVSVIFIWTRSESLFSPIQCQSCFTITLSVLVSWGRNKGGLLGWGRGRRRGRGRGSEQIVYIEVRGSALALSQEVLQEYYEVLSLPSKIRSSSSHVLPKKY